MLDHYYGVVMAGGGGTRLWPLSRQQRPKQMLNLFGEQSMFQEALHRLYDALPPERVYVVTVAEQAAVLQAQAPEVPAENFLIEPAPRGTASVVGLAAAALAACDPQAIMAIVTSDHYIGNHPLYRQLLQAAHQAAQDGYLVTLGIEPLFPSTGFGYIQRGAALGIYQDLPLYRVERFKEKPTQSQAEELLAQGDHVWNSGMFFWQVDRILSEFQRQMPDLYAGLSAIQNAWHTPQRSATVERIWRDLRPETIDYGIMEHAERVAVLPASGLQWNDVGAWESLYEVMPCDTDGNIIVGGQHLSLDSRQTLIYVDQKATPSAERLVVTIGVENLVVVDTADVLLVCRRDQAQRVRQAVSQLKETQKETGQNYL